MDARSRRFLANANFLVSAGAGAWALYLIAWLFVPVTVDSHSGLASALAGLCVLPVALAAFATGKLFLRGRRAAWALQLATLALATLALRWVA